jgi:putative ABC transport system permease protein
VIIRRHGSTNSGAGRGPLGLEKPRVTARSLIREALAGVVQRPGRSALTATGTVLGVGAVIAVLGITTSANSQVVKEFTRLSATQLTITSAPTTQDADPAASEPAIPLDADARLMRLRGVVSAGAYTPINDVDVGSSYAPDGSRVVEGGTNVIAVSDSFWRTVHPQVIGRTFDGYLATQRVAVIGSALAQSLGIGSVAGSPTITLDGVPFVVVGIETDTRRVPDTLIAVTIPEEAAIGLWGIDRIDVPERKAIVETTPGAVSRVAEQAAVALRADEPEVISVTAPVQPRKLQDRVSEQLRLLFIAIAAILLFVGTIGIANTTLIAVLERVPEIGLRRALGARPRHVSYQFLLESLVLGVLGGLIGTTLGVLTVVAVAVTKEWTAVVPASLVPLGPVLGALTGLAAGAYPAFRASRIEPIEAFRR